MQLQIPQSSVGPSQSAVMQRRKKPFGIMPGGMTPEQGMMAGGSMGAGPMPQPPMPQMQQAPMVGAGKAVGEWSLGGNAQGWMAGGEPRPAPSPVPAPPQQPGGGGGMSPKPTPPFNPHAPASSGDWNWDPAAGEWLPNGGAQPGGAPGMPGGQSPGMPMPGGHPAGPGGGRMPGQGGQTPPFVPGHMQNQMNEPPAIPPMKPQKPAAAQLPNLGTGQTQAQVVDNRVNAARQQRPGRLRDHVRR